MWRSEGGAPSALLLSGSSGWQASEVACGKGNGMDCSGGCRGRGVDYGPCVEKFLSLLFPWRKIQSHDHA